MSSNYTSEQVADHIVAMVQGLATSPIGQEILRRAFRTPDTSLPPFEPDATKRRKMLVEIEVSTDFEQRLDNQWEVEREINADRWSWRWADGG